MQAHGYMIDVEFDGQTLTAEGTTKAARIALRAQDHDKGPLVVARDRMTEVTFKDASALVNGKLTITTPEGKHVLHFRKKQAADFRVLADQLGATVA